MFEKAKLKWRSQTTTDRLYTLTIVFACTGYASTFFFRGNFLFFGIALTISSSLFVIGFFRWIWAWLGDKWKTKLGKFIISALSAAIWFLAIILSRIFVAKALGLPPQDFETTVYIVAFWLYPALCFLLLSVTMLIISLMFILLGFSCAIASTITDSPIFRIPFIFPQNLYPQWITSIQIRTRTFIETIKNKFMLRFIGHAIGATIICFAAAQA